MREIIIGKDEANQRLDKFLAKYLDKAPKSFIYKMLRKKNIVLNDQKCKGDEKIGYNDCVKLLLSDETLEKFCTSRDLTTMKDDGKNQVIDLDVQRILYEDADCILYNKPSGMLSQKSKPSDISLNERLVAYLEKKKGRRFDKMFMPSICNRLDRNTSGIVIFGSSLQGLQELNHSMKHRSIKKEYLCIVIGEMDIGKEMYIRGYLVKDEMKNTVRIIPSSEYKEQSDAGIQGKISDCKPIETDIKVLDTKKGLSLLLVHLITGRSHQIRAHLSSVGHPILGDEKYGWSHVNRQYKKYGIHSQMLHAYRLTFPKEMALKKLAGRSFLAGVPDVFSRLGFTRQRIEILNRK